MSEFFIKNMDAVALRINKDNTCDIIIKGDLDRDAHKNRYYNNGEKSIIEIISTINCLKKEGLIDIYWYDNDVVDSTHWYNKEEHTYHDDVLINNKGERIEVTSFDHLFSLMTSGTYTVESGKGIVSVLYCTKLTSKGTIVDFIKENCSTFIYPSSILTQLVKNEFKTPEQRRFKKQQWATWVSIGIAILIGLMSIWLSNNSVELIGIEGIKQEIRNTKTEIPAVIQTKITNDTIKVDVVKPTPIKKK